MHDPTRDAGFSGIVYCLFGLFAFAVQDALVKELSQRYPVLEILTLRILVVLIVLLAIGLFSYGGSVLRAAQPLLLLGRGVLAFTAFTSYYLALTTIPLADAAAVFMSAPLFVTALSVPLLGERVGRHRWLAVALGFVAVLVMINPGVGALQLAAALPLFSAVTYALIPIISRSVGRADRALTMALYASFAYFLACCAATAVVAWLGFQNGPAADGLFAQLRLAWSLPGGADALVIVLSGALFIVGLLGLTQAYRTSPVSVVAPFEYSYLLWATLAGWLFFDDLPGARTLLGGAAVVACGCYILARERAARA